MHEISRPASLTGKVAIVTGAARGIGQAISVALAREGADIAAFDVQPLDETLERVRALGVRAIGLRVDVRSARDVSEAVSRVVAEFGRIDILVNNAGTCARKSLEATTEEDWYRDMDTSAKGAFLMIQAVYPIMKRQRSGKIVNVASVSGQAGGAVSRPEERAESAEGRSGPAYAAAKGALIALTKWVAKDAGQYGIYCNAVAPGPVRTEMTRGFDYAVERYPIPRMGEPEDIAEAVVFLASDRSNYVTGHTLDVNGGSYMR